MYVRSAKPKGALLSCVGGSSLDRRAGARSVVHAGVGGGRPAGTRTVRDPRRATWFHVWGYYIIASRGEGPAIYIVSSGGFHVWGYYIIASRGEGPAVYIVSSGGEGPACYMKRPCQRTQLREWYETTWKSKCHSSFFITDPHSKRPASGDRQMGYPRSRAPLSVRPLVVEQGVLLLRCTQHDEESTSQ